MVPTLVSQLILRSRDRFPHVDSRCKRDHRMKHCSGWHQHRWARDAHYQMISSVHVDTSADQRWISAVPPAPQRVANHQHALFSNLLFIGGKSAASFYRNTEEREEVRRYAGTSNTLRLAVAGEIAFPGPQGAHGREGCI